MLCYILHDSLLLASKGYPHCNGCCVSKMPSHNSDALDGCAYLCIPGIPGMLIFLLSCISGLVALLVLVVRILESLLSDLSHFDLLKM